MLLDAAVDALVAAGLPRGSTHWILCLMLSPVVCALHACLPGTSLRNLASLVLGAGMCYFAYGDDSANLFVSSAGVYVTMLLYRRRCGVLCFAGTMAFLLYCHVASASGESWRQGNINFTGTQMVLTTKLVSIAFDYQDGLVFPARAAPYVLEHRLGELPSVLDFLGYCFYPGNILAGPWVPTTAYLQFVRRLGPWAPRDGGKRAPSGLLPGVGAMLAAVAAAAVHMTLTPLVPDEAFTSSWWPAKSTGYKLGFMYVMGFAARCKYYFVWKWAEAAMDWGGIGFSGWAPDGRTPQWERGRNLNVLGVELATSAAELPLNWNRRTGDWLRHYCYERVCPPGSKGLRPFFALLWTQTITSLWHGVFAGYYMFFISSALMLHVGKVVYRYQRALPRAAARAVAAVHTVLTAFHLNYLACVFIAIRWEPSIAAWRSVHFIGHWSMLAIILWSIVLPPPAKREGGAKRE